MSPRSRGRQPKKSGKSKRTNKRPSPASGRATAAGPGHSGLRIELPRSPLDRSSLAAAGVFDDAESAVAAWRKQVGDAASGVQPVTPQVLAWLSHAEHSEGLIGEREQGALLDDYFRGPRRIQDITRKLVGRCAELPHGDPVAAQEAFTAWYAMRHGNVPDQDAAEALAEEWLAVMLPGTEHAVSPRRSAAFRDQITNWWDDEDTAGALLLLPEWIRWNGEQAGVPPDLISDAVAAAERRSKDTDEY